MSQSEIRIVGWDRDTEDYNGRSQREVFYLVFNGKERAVGKSDLLRLVKLNLPERAAEAADRTEPTIVHGGNSK